MAADLASRGDWAYRQLLDLLDDGSLAEGGKLPTESELILRLGLSRSSLREALARLKAEGRTTSRRGSGTFVARSGPTELVRMAPIASVDDLLDWQELRIAIESEVASLAAERRTDADIAALQGSQSRLIERLLAGDYAGREDADFHMALARAAQNPKLVDAVSSLTRHILGWIELTRVRNLLTPGERHEILAAEHQQIVDAVIGRRADEARAALRRHLLNGRARVFGSLRR
jgi:DNA-binding FadR family transcriptional regulator